MAPTAPSSANPQCSCPPPNASAQPPDHLPVNIKTTHAQDTTIPTPNQNPSPSVTPRAEEDPSTPPSRAQPSHKPTPTTPSLPILPTILSHLSTQRSTLTALLTHMDRLEASTLEHQLQQTRLSRKQHSRLGAKVDGIDGILTCIHDEFHGEGEDGNKKRMCERIEQMEKLVVWAWSEMMEMRRGVEGRMGRVQEGVEGLGGKIEMVVGLLEGMGGREGKTEK